MLLGEPPDEPSRSTPSRFALDPIAPHLGPALEVRREEALVDFVTAKRVGRRAAKRDRSVESAESLSRHQHAAVHPPAHGLSRETKVLGRLAELAIDTSERRNPDRLLTEKVVDGFADRLETRLAHRMSVSDCLGGAHRHYRKTRRKPLELRS